MDYSGYDIEILREIQRKRYIVRIERVRVKGSLESRIFHNAYTLKDELIGNVKYAEMLCDSLHVVPQKITSNDRYCSIGYCQETRKWYGWNNKMICNFGIGDRIFDPEYGSYHTPYSQHGEKEIVTLEDAKKAAINFVRFINAL